MQPITYEKTPPVPAPEHQYAKLFPMLEGEAFERLKADIKENGVLEPIVFLDGHILDGRNRYYAARSLLIEYPRVDYDGDDPLAFVIGKNLHRRHLTDRQRADVAAKLAKLPKGRPAENPSNEGITVADAAKAMEVSVAAVERAKVVQEHASPGLKAAYEAGTVSPSAAAEVAKLPAQEQEEIVAYGDDAIVDAAKQIIARRKEERLAKRAENNQRREEAAAQFSPEVQEHRANAEERRAQAKAAKTLSSGDVDALRAEIAEKDEYIASLEAEVADLKRQITKFDDMVVQYEQGGFEKVVAGKDEEIRVLETRLYSTNADMVSWKKKAAWEIKEKLRYKHEAEKRGYVDVAGNEAGSEAGAAA